MKKNILRHEEWISIQDELPEYGVKVLLIPKKDTMYAHFNPGEEFVIGQLNEKVMEFKKEEQYKISYIKIDEVQYWMTIPTVPTNL